MKDEVLLLLLFPSFAAIGEKMLRFGERAFPFEEVLLLMVLFCKEEILRLLF